MKSKPWTKLDINKPIRYVIPTNTEVNAQSNIDVLTRISFDMRFNYGSTIYLTSLYSIFNAFRDVGTNPVNIGAIWVPW